MPCLALIPELKKYFDEIVYVGSEGGMEKELVSKENIPFYTVNSIKFNRTKPLKNLKIPFTLPYCIKDAKILLRELKPDVIFSKGGYVSLPITLAAKKLNIPYVIHESDYSMGLANKLVAKNAEYVMTNFESASTAKNAIKTGIPLKESLFSQKSKSQILNELKLPTRKTILVTGGSLGAVRLNEVLSKCIPTLEKRYNVIHLTGKKNTISQEGYGYIKLPFSDRMGELYKVADVVVSRAGATTLSELEALGKSAVLVPLSQKASRGDQIKNAKEFSKKEGFITILDEELNEKSLIKAIEQLFIENYAKTPQSELPNRRIVELIYGLTK